MKDYEGKVTAVTLLETRCVYQCHQVHAYRDVHSISELQTVVETQDKKLQRAESTIQEFVLPCP